MSACSKLIANIANWRSMIWAAAGPKSPTRNSPFGILFVAMGCKPHSAAPPATVGIFPNVFALPRFYEAQALGITGIYHDCGVHSHRGKAGSG